MPRAMPTRLRMPPGELRRKLLHHLVRVEIDERQLLAHALLDLVVVERRVLAQRIGDVLEHGHRVEQRGALEHHPHVLPRLERLLEGEVGDVLAVDADLAAVRHEQAQDELEHRALAGARLADEADRLALPRLERDVLEDRTVEGEIDVIELDDGRRAMLLRVRLREVLVGRLVGQLVADGAADRRRPPLGRAPALLTALGRALVRGGVVGGPAGGTARGVAGVAASRTSSLMRASTESRICVRK